MKERQKTSEPTGDAPLGERSDVQCCWLCRQRTGARIAWPAGPGAREEPGVKVCRGSLEAEEAKEADLLLDR